METLRKLGSDTFPPSRSKKANSTKENKAKSSRSEASQRGRCPDVLEQYTRKMMPLSDSASEHHHGPRPDDAQCRQPGNLAKGGERDLV